MRYTSGDVERGEKYGQYLLIDAIKKLLFISETVGFPFIVVDAKEGASSFYQNFGFKAFKEEGNRLFITIEEVRKNFKS